MARAKQVFNGATGRWEDMPTHADANGDRRTEDEGAAIDQRADGSLRRPGKGGRTFASMFAPENLSKAMTRGDYLNQRCSEEFSRREQVWWRRAWRWLTHRPAVKDQARYMANAHGQSLADLETALRRKAAVDAIAAQSKALGGKPE